MENVIEEGLIMKAVWTPLGLEEVWVCYIVKKSRTICILNSRDGTNVIK